MTKLSQRGLEAFRAVVEVGSVSRAAELLNISQPAVSRLIRDLENRTGLKLFTRKGGRIAATPEARELVETVDRAFVGLSEVEQAANDIREGNSGSVSVAAMPALAHSILPEVLEKLLRERRRCRISVLALDTGETLRHLSSRRAHMGFIAPSQTDSDVEAVESFDLPFRCILPADGPWRNRNSVTLEDFSGRPFVGFADNTANGRLLDRRFMNMPTPPVVLMRSNLAPILSSLVLRGAGVSVVDPFTARTHEERGGRSLPLDDDIRFGFLIVRPFGYQFGPDLDLLLTLFRRTVRGFC